MAGFQHSKNSVYKFDIPSGSSEHTLSLQDISAYVTGVEGLPGIVEVTEITTLADAGRKFFGDVMKDSQITLNLLWNSDPSSSGAGAPNALEDWFGGTVTNAPSTVTRSFEFSPDTTASGRRKFTGECWISALTERSALGEIVVMDATLQVDGEVTIGTH